MFARSHIPLLVCLFVLTFAPPLPAQSPRPTPAPPDTYLQIPIWGDSGEKKLQSGDLEGAVEDFKKAFEGSRALRRENPQEPSYAVNAYHYLGRLATTYAKANNFAQAVKLGDTGARGFAELASANPTVENKENATNAYGPLSWYQLLNKDSAAAEASARKALEFTPDVPLVNVNLAHALLLNGRRAEAEALYLAERAKDAGDGRTVGAVILEDFAAMEAAGINNPAIGEIRAALGGSESKTPTVRRRAKAKSDFPVWPLIVGILFIIGALFALFIYLDRKRTAKLAAAAQALGLTFRAKATAEDKTLSQGSTIATMGHSRALRNVIELPESDGTQMTLFDYSYIVGHGKTSRTHNQTVTRIASTRLNLTAFDLRPESILAKIAQTLGYKDIDIEGWPNFSKKYLLRGPDDAAIRQLFTAPILQYCEESRGLWISGVGQFLWFHRDNVRPKPENLAAFVESARQTAALFLGPVASSGTTPPPTAPPPPLPPPPLPPA